MAKATKERAGTAQAGETQADRIRSYLEQAPNTSRRVSEVAEAIGADDAGRLGSYLANLARRGTITRTGTGLYAARPHEGAASSATTGRRTTPEERTAPTSGSATRRRPGRRGRVATEEGSTTRPTLPAAETTTPTLTTAGTLDDGRIILRTPDGELWVAEPLGR